MADIEKIKGVLRSARAELLSFAIAGIRSQVEGYASIIAPEHIEKVFNPFFTTGRSLGACGLGLSIIHNLVTHPMQGTVELTSAVGKGTRITLDLPREREA
jgi:K+-sensing histidine kinase KdpD